MQPTTISIAESQRNNLVSGAEPVDCFYPAILIVNPGHDSPATLNPPPGLEKQFDLVESPPVKSGLRLLRAKILTAAALLGCLLVRCLAVLFDLEIRLFHWLTRAAHEHSLRQYVRRCTLVIGRTGHKASKSAEPQMSSVLVGYQGRTANRSNEFINVAFGI
jgi:hypothetical protein